jgi:hypothetical protein
MCENTSKSFYSYNADVTLQAPPYVQAFLAREWLPFGSKLEVSTTVSLFERGALFVDFS